MDDDLAGMSREELIEEVLAREAGSVAHCAGLARIHPRLCAVPAIAGRAGTQRATLVAAVRPLSWWR
jgi:hypothetical protein